MEVAASEGLATIVVKPVIFREIAQLVAVVVVADKPVFVAPVIGAARRVIMRIPVVMAGVLTSAEVATDSAALLAEGEVARTSVTIKTVSKSTATMWAELLARAVAKFGNWKANLVPELR